MKYPSNFNMKKNLEEHQNLLKVLPPDTKRVLVLEESGKKTWRKIEEVRNTDILVKNSDGGCLTMNKKPGRRSRKDALDHPLEPVNPAVKKNIDAKLDVILIDPIVRAMSNKIELDAVDLILGGMAEETASLLFERREAERKGDPTISYSSKRITGLKNMAEVLLRKQEQLQKKTIDLDSLAFQNIFIYILETVKEVLEKEGNLTPLQIERLFNSFEDAFDDTWKARAKVRMRG